MKLGNIIDNMLDEEYETLKANACKNWWEIKKRIFLKKCNETKVYNICEVILNS